MKSSTETSMLQTRKLLDLKRETVQKLLSLHFYMVLETPKSEALLEVLRELEPNLNEYFSKTHHLLELYEKELNMPLFEAISKD